MNEHAISAYKRFLFKIDEKKLDEVVDNLFKEADKEIQSLPLPIICQSGCSYCCHQEVMIHAGEGPIIEKYILNKLNKNEKKEIFNNFKAWYTDENRSKLPYNFPCPLLIDSKCSIYPVRPLVCRMHVVVDSVALCEKEPYREGYFGKQNIQEKYFEKLTESSGGPAYQWFPFPVAEAFGVLDAPMPTITTESYLKKKRNGK